MDKKTIKSVIYNISFQLGIDNKINKNSSLFYSEEFEHNITKDFLESIINEENESSPFEIYKQILIPVIEANPNKHFTVSSIYHLLAVSCIESDEQVSKNYFELYFKHMILAKHSMLKVEGVSKFYLTVVTRESCCGICKAYTEIYNFEVMLKEFPLIIKKCEHSDSCRAAVSVMTENRYNAILKSS